MHARNYSLFFSVLMMAVSWHQTLVGQPLVLGGSDLLGNAVGEVLDRELAEAGLQVTIDFAGSLAAEDGLGSRKLDAAIVAVREPSPLPGETERFPVAFQVAAFAVHPENPVNELTTDQLAALFRDREPLENWSELTEDRDWSDRKVAPLVARLPNSMGLEIFNAFVLEGERLHRNVRVFEDEGRMGEAQMADSGFLALVPYNRSSAEWKYLAVSEPDGQGFTPSTDNIFFGDYFLRLPFQLVVTERVFPDQLEKLMKVLYGDAMVRALEAGNFVPLPLTERQSLLQEVQ